MKIKGVIFDFNGTLFQDTTLHIASWIQFLKEKKGIEINEAEFMEKIYGRDNIQIIKTFFKEIQDQNELEALSEEKEQLYRQLCRQNKDMVHLVKGAENFFDQLKENKIPFTIATGANVGNVRYYFEEFHLAQWFDWNQVIYDDGRLPGKPDPTVYLLALEKIGVKAEDTLVFEDSPAGITAAKKAGIGRIIQIGETSSSTLADGCAQDFSDALHWLQ